MSQIFRVFEDSEGYIWYGTQGGGLSRDDGYSVKTFRSDYTTPNMLESNWITCITEDNKNRIWFGTKRGLYILNKENYQISQITDSEIKNWNIDAITAAEDGTIWVSTNKTVIHYNSNQQKLDTYNVKWQQKLKNISQIYEDQSHNIWIIQWKGGILKFNAQENRFIPYPWPFKESPTYISQDINSKNYWISTWGKGLIKFNPNAKKLKQTYTVFNDIFLPSSSKSYISNFVQDKTLNNLWTITKNDIITYNTTDKKLSIVDISNHLPEGHKLLNQIITDKKGNLWVAADYPKSFILSFNQKSYHRTSVPKTNNKLKLPTTPSTFIYEDDKYWFWQKRKGLFLYNTTKQKLTYLSDTPGLKFQKKSVLIEKAQHRKGVYTILNDTIVVLLSQKNNQLNIPEKIVQIPKNQRIHTLHQDVNDNLWIGTNNTLYKYQIHQKKLTPIVKNIGTINKISTNLTQKTLLATEKNGFCIIRHNGSLIKYEEDKNFSCIAVAPNHKIWAGTEQGDLFYLNEGSDKMTSIKNQAGLNGDAIIALEVDSNGSVWVLTNQRIVVYNPKTLSSKIIFNSDPNVDMNHFLNLRKDYNGTIHISGMGGFCSFPTNYKTNEKNPIVKLTQIDINGDSQFINNTNNKIILQPYQQNIKLFFSTLNHSDSDRIRYAFKYKNKDWEYLQEGVNSIFLTKLSKGKYNLELKATNNNGQWSTKTTYITINRLPAWYETFWAYLIYVFFLFSFLLACNHFYLRYKKRKLIDKQIHNSAMDLQDLVYQFTEHKTETETDEKLNLKSLLLDLKKILLKQRQENSKTKEKNSSLSSVDEKLIQKALKLVEKNIDATNYSVEQLSNDLGMDRTGLYRKLVHIIGKTPTNFIKSIRLKRASKLLKEGFTVAEVADRVGFGTASYLSKCFKDEFGVKPSEYARKNNNTTQKT